jgi:hypothetical protein
LLTAATIPALSKEFISGQQYGMIPQSSQNVI